MITDLREKEIDGKYRITELIRETELGDFYHAANIATGEPLIIKILAPAMAIDTRYVENFLKDVSASAVVTHQNILRNIEIGSDSQVIPFAVFEDPKGNLLRVAQDSAALEVPRAIGIVAQIASGLVAAHSAGLLHSGLNPDKVLVVENGDGDVVKVFDFGSRGHAVNSVDAIGYLAPEQSLHSPTADERSDIYALGAILYEMLAGELPFPGSMPAEIISKRTSDAPPPLSAFRDDLHPQLEPIVLSAISTDPDKRYQTMQEFEEDLRRIGNDIGTVIPETKSEIAMAAASGSRRSIWQAAGIVVIGVGLLAAALIYGTSVRQTNPTASLVPDANGLPVQPINPATGAQEETLSRMGDIGDASVVPGSGEFPSDLPGGDGYNAWANGAMPPAGAPLSGSTIPMPPYGEAPPQYIPPGGQVVTVDPNGGSQFMPNDSGVILVPIPQSTEPEVKPTAVPKSQPANAQSKPADTSKPPASKPPSGESVPTEKQKPKSSDQTSNGKGSTEPNKSTNVGLPQT